jgi:hypothetical protein
MGKLQWELVLEILIGLLVIYGAIGKASEAGSSGMLLVQLAAGMYVIIRGFRSLGIGLRRLICLTNTGTPAALH